MFGYVRLFKPNITIGEYEQYQGLYCTLCKRLGKRYGVLSRFTLSYDMTFLALIEMALANEGPCFASGRCSFNPTKKCLKATNTTALDRAADIGMLLTYYKLKDTLADEGFGQRIKARLVQPYVAYKRKKAAKRRPEEDALIAETMAKQAALEAEHTASIDRAAEPFALMLQYLASSAAVDHTQRRVLERFGYCLGRWIYLIDAVDDLDKDLKEGHYNPYIYARSLSADRPEEIAATRLYARETLNACLAECIAAYDLLEVRRFDGLLLNILEQGMPHTQKRVIAGEELTK